MNSDVTKFAAVILAFGLLSAAPATAAGKVKSNCKDEIAKFCSTAGDGAPLLTCLTGKMADLSDNCKKNVEMKAAGKKKK